MLTSLFGELGPPKDPAKKSDTEGPAPEQGGFAATAILESLATEVNQRGQMIDRHQHDLVVSGSPAQAIRAHFATTRADLGTASRLITLLDPTGIWASAVIKALSDAGGRPIERLHLREQTTLRTLATIERTTLVRRHEDTLKIYHADVRAPGRENAAIPVALMERSHLSTVIVGPMQPHAVDALIEMLKEASTLPTWRCPNLLFMLPPGTPWIASKISAVSWPRRLQVHVLSESMSSASSVWNAMLGMWNHVKTQPAWEPPEPMQGLVAGDESTQAPPDIAAPQPATPPPQGALMEGNHRPLAPADARTALAEMAGIDGLLCCAVVDAATGLVLAKEAIEDEGSDFDLCAAACAQVLRAHRMAARNMGMSEHIDEIIVSAGHRHQVLRTVSGQHDLFLMALLNKDHANLALARYKLTEVEKRLA
jgi:predicted regulator of Ras-like GTPase activity (Roadblock/LC7/MglB family)